MSTDFETNMKVFVAGKNLQRQRERAATQMTRGNIIEVLEAMPPDTKVSNLIWVPAWVATFVMVVMWFVMVFNVIQRCP